MSRLRRVALRLHGGGRFPDDLRALLAREGLILLEEELFGVYRCRLPGAVSTRAFAGGVAVTGERLVVWTGRVARHLDVAHGHSLRRLVTVTADRPDRVVFCYDAGLFRPDRPGTREIRLRTPQARLLAELLASFDEPVP
ncbi:hypothetical protein [Streptomyces sp. 7-21]|uniref:hypothetical protein n=1 Tax=Streptomyces sp. 7-21 TaxID=2802283 RepID=UPI00191CD4F9|nr:hypothetical protein [Streptomyces sp. 7-21]MBL1065223.1 hypothetical protein [Streptomyces sp. 7-21]